MKIGFFWTPHLSAQVLEACIRHPEIEVAFVVTNPDAKSGRGQKLSLSPVKQLALSHEIPVFAPEKIRKNTEFFEELHAYGCDYFVVVAYGKILPNEILEMPKRLPINMHGSILPKYRGASPIQSALLFWEKETGVTIMRMGEKMDEGDILAIKKIQIASDETSASLFEKFGEVSPDFLIQTLFGHFRGEVAPVAQNHDEATYCQKFTKEQGKIEPNLSAEELYRRYQAYTPWPTLYGEFEEKRLIFARISLPTSGVPDSVLCLPPGRVARISDTVYLNTGNGALILEELKLEWEKSRNAQDFCIAHPLFQNTTIS